MYFLERDDSLVIGDILHNAKQELQRADHLMFVSLKYTRTVDVIKGIVLRLINSFDICFEALLNEARTVGKISEVPIIPRVRAGLVREVFHPRFDEFIDFYCLLRDINNSQFDRTQEYRRHVTMTVLVNNKPIEITIDIIEDYFQKAKEFIDMLDQESYKK